ncbi:hypothetical protein EB796_012827 [Bugula neritina]|uniref:Uncharacterized protein n=1 Tax=Bugula neritina TaxID=10212 RepID=A0A7J7JR57_BUGNE|nr:hypothetical protein EB796_012827 [Bugula neritina]
MASSSFLPMSSLVGITTFTVNDKLKSKFKENSEQIRSPRLITTEAEISRDHNSTSMLNYSEKGKENAEARKQLKQKQLQSSRDTSASVGSISGQPSKYNTRNMGKS